MAGTLQSLILSPATSRTVRLCPRNMRFSSHGDRLAACPVKIGPHLSTLRPIRASEASSGQVGGNDYAPKMPEKVKVGNPFSKFVADNFLPLALIGGVALGLANPSLGCLADRYYLSKFSTVGIFIISGLTLRSGEIGAAAEAWPVGIFGLGSILLVTPYFSKLILQIQLQPQEFVTGLAIFSCMPTTLSSGVALTQLAGGNSALALAMTVISSLLGIILVSYKIVFVSIPPDHNYRFSEHKSCARCYPINLLLGSFFSAVIIISVFLSRAAVPFSISKFIADGVGVTVPTEQLFKSLVLTLLIPLILGKILRESFRGLADFVDDNRKFFSRISAVFLSLVPWIQVSRSRSLLVTVQPAMFLVAIGMGTVLHLILLAFNAFAIRFLSTVTGGDQSVFAKKENASAALLVASQKTLPVMVAVVEQLGGAFGESGLLVLPCVAAHLIQIIMDSFLVNFWLRKDAASNIVKVA